MVKHLINRAFYEAVRDFESSEEAQECYYRVMDTQFPRLGGEEGTETVRDKILRAYAMLFCDDIGIEAGKAAGPDEVEATADRLYVGTAAFDPRHWYRMQNHFPVINEDNYDRFAALVIADLHAGPLRRGVEERGEMLLFGEANPLAMTKEDRARQRLRPVSLGEEVDLL